MRLRHAARFALPNLVAVLVVALGYELFEVYGRGDVPSGMGPGEVLAADMAVWVVIAAVMGAVTFLLRLSDVVTRVPTWSFAWIGAGWVALSSVLVVHALEVGRVGLAAATGALAALFWLAVHRHLPGWPGAFVPPPAEPRVSEQDLR